MPTASHPAAKYFAPTFTDDLAEAIGYAINKTRRPLEGSACPFDRELSARLKDAAHELDTCPEFEGPADPSNAFGLAAIAAARAAAALDAYAAALDRVTEAEIAAFNFSAADTAQSSAAAHRKLADAIRAESAAR